jgi:hypothetical protein
MRGLACAATALAVAVLSACTTAVQQIHAVAEVAVPRADTVSQSRSFAYERVVVHVEPEDAMMLMTGLSCVHGQGFARSGHYAAADQELENTCLGELSRAGYSVVRRVESDDLFADRRNMAADFRVAALVTHPRMSVCFSTGSFGSVGSRNGEASITVEWQVYSNAAKAVVYRSVQKGYARFNNSVEGLPRDLWRGAFARATRGLLADTGFIAIARGDAAAPAVGR